MPARYQKVLVQLVSLETYEDDGELFGDEGFQVAEGYGIQERELLLACLTARQRQVAELLFSGHDRPEIAAMLQPKVCTQAIHQIVLRIRKRLSVKAGISLKGWKKRHGHY